MGAGSISGDNFDVSVIPHDLLRPLQSTSPSGPWLFPAPSAWGDEVNFCFGYVGYFVILNQSFKNTIKFIWLFVGFLGLGVQLQV